MNTHSLNPNWVTLVLLVTLAVVIAILPIASALRPAPVTLEYTLVAVSLPQMAFVGADGTINPNITARTGDTVNITLISGDSVIHDLVLPDFNVATGQLTRKDQQVTVTFIPSVPGEFTYYASIPGHREAGMMGKLIVNGA